METSMHVIEFPNLKKTRRYGAKVRTGCITCKARRVKCDEGRPACLRCMSTGRTCEGYTREQALFPVANLNQASVLRYTVPTIPGFSEDDLYLDFYHRCASHTVTGHLDADFWTRIVMQMGSSEPAVRHALIALGYLFKTEPGDIKHARSSALTKNQSRTFLSHYNRAVRSLVDRMTQPSYSSEVGFVTCLLFICIEFIRGEFRMAFTHLSSGLKLLAEWQQRQLTISSSSSPSQPSSPASFASSSVSSSLVEEILRPLFIRTISPALLFGAPIEQLFEIPTPRPQDFCGQIYKNVIEARASSLDLRNATLLFARTMAQKLFERVPLTPVDYEYQANLLECYHALSPTLDYLENQQDIFEGDKIVLGAVKCAHHAAYIMLACAMDVDQAQYDAHIPTFKALLHEAEICLDSIIPRYNNYVDHPSPPVDSNGALPAQRPSARFTFEISLTPVLQLAALRCRCPETRREAISLLERNPPREALWDPVQIVAVANRVIEIEEQELDPVTGRPVERKRLWSSVIDGNMDKNGGFWVSFSFAGWILKRNPQDPQQGRRPDSQWDEWFVL